MERRWGLGEDDEDDDEEGTYKSCVKSKKTQIKEGEMAINEMWKD